MRITDYPRIDEGPDDWMNDVPARGSSLAPWAVVLSIIVMTLGAILLIVATTPAALPSGPLPLCELDALVTSTGLPCWSVAR